MKTETIKSQIIENYRILSLSAKVPAWGLEYKHNGSYGNISQIGIFEKGNINQIGLIERGHSGNSSIKIINGNQLQLQKKPFYLTWKRTLKNINSMLKKIIENIDNSKIVTKNFY